MSGRILTVEDDERTRTAVSLALEEEGWEVEETSNADEDQEISSCLNDSYHTKQVEEELQVAAKAEADELRGSHRVLAEDYEVRSSINFPSKLEVFCASDSADFGKNSTFSAITRNDINYSFLPKLMFFL